MRARPERFAAGLSVKECSPVRPSARERFPEPVFPSLMWCRRKGLSSLSTQAVPQKPTRSRRNEIEPSVFVLFEMGITLCEVCALRLADVDPTTGMLSVRGKGGKIRRMSLGSTCLSHLRSYLDQAHPANKNAMARRKTGDDPLFVSEQDHALTKSSLTSLVSRLRTRAGSSEIAITPQLLRHSFVLRYLQAGGDPRGLQELLGYEGMAQIKLYLRWQSQLLHNRAEQSSTDLIER
jgi:site-specific recombinase XerD